MRVQRLTTRLSLPAAFGLALAAAVLAAPAPARAAEDDVPIDTKILRNILGGLGLKRPGEGEINYQERAPLVIPPAQDLPPPQQHGAAIANNPAWPNDPDIARAKLSAKEEQDYGSTEMVEREQNPLRPDQMAPSSRVFGKRQAPKSDGNVAPPDGFANPMKPSELGYKGGLFSNMFGSDDNANAKFTGEPVRSSLTDPPAGYQIPSPDQPYGLGKAASTPKADQSYQTRGEGR